MDIKASRQIADVIDGACAKFVEGGLPVDLVMTALMGAAIRAASNNLGPQATITWLRATADEMEKAPPAHIAGCAGTA